MRQQFLCGVINHKHLSTLDPAQAKYFSKKAFEEYSKHVAVSLANCNALTEPYWTSVL